MLILLESNGRDWSHSGLPENPSSLGPIFSIQIEPAF
jgi:hypothetical protein